MESSIIGVDKDGIFDIIGVDQDGIFDIIEVEARWNLYQFVKSHMRKPTLLAYLCSFRVYLEI